MTAETCQICGKTKNVNAVGHCQGHDNPSSSKQRLDAIRSAGASGRSVVTESPGLSLKEQLDAIPAPSSAGQGHSAPASAPPVGAGGVKKGPGSILGRKTGAGTEDISNLKSQLDAIPAPASGGVNPEVASKDLLDAIPTPRSGGRAPEPNFRKSSDSIPAVTPAPSPAGGGSSLLDQLNAIPTPSVSGAGPQPGGASKPTGEVPEWMRNFEKHQSAISESIVQGGQQSAANYGGGYGGGGSGAYGSPDTVPASYGASRGGAEEPPQGSAYTMVIGIVILICIAMFGYLMISKPAPSVMPSTDSSTSSSPPPVTTPVQSTPFNANPTPAPTPMPGAVPGTVPGTPQSMTPSIPGTVPGTPQSMQQGTVPSSGNNPVMPTGNNP